MECGLCLGTGRCHICGGRARSNASGVVTLCPTCRGRGQCRGCTSVATAAVRSDGVFIAAEAGTAPGGTTVHLARKTLEGLRAACGAGPVVTHVGRFDPNAPDSCLECLLAT